MEYQDTLIIILSVGMSITLLLVIIALYYVVKVMQAVRRITEKAEHIAQNVDAASEFFKKSAGPAAFGKLISNIVEVVRKQSKSKKEK